MPRCSNGNYLTRLLSCKQWSGDRDAHAEKKIGNRSKKIGLLLKRRQRRSHQKTPSQFQKSLMNLMYALSVVTQHLGNAAFATGIFIAANIAKIGDLDLIYSLAPSARSRPLIIYSDVSAKTSYLMMKMYAKVLASIS